MSDVSVFRRLFDVIVEGRGYYVRRPVLDELLKTAPFRDEVVLNGPFAGMSYTYGHLPKLLGSYEDELHGIIEEIVAREYAKIIDIGSADGYYVNGFAKRCPHAEIISFEAVPELNASNRENLTTNGIKNVSVRGTCDNEKLNACEINGDTLVFCDIDGAEVELIDPAKSPALLECDLLVEVHDFFAPEKNITETLRHRFSATHTLTEISEGYKEAARYPQLAGLPTYTIRLALNEDRISDVSTHDQRWLLMKKNR